MIKSKHLSLVFSFLILLCTIVIPHTGAAECSPDYNQAFINEFNTKSGNVEIYFTASATSGTYDIKVCRGESWCEDESLVFDGSDNWLFTSVDLIVNNDNFDITLYDPDGYVADYINVHIAKGNGNGADERSFFNTDHEDCESIINSISNNDNSPHLIERDDSGQRQFYRETDGSDEWVETGHNKNNTYGGPNSGSLPDLHHLEIIHDGSAVACVPEEITLRACADAECSSLYLDGVDGTLTAGGNSRDFSIPAETADTEVSIYVSTDGTAAGDPQLVTLGLENLSTQPVTGYRCSNTSADSDSCGIEVYKAGLVFDVPDQIAGVESGEVEIKAVQSSDTDPTVCTPLFEGGERSVCFWGQYTDPDTGSGETIKLDDNDIETVVAGTTPECAYKALIFDQGSAELPGIRYDDVGKMQLHARYEGSEEHDDEGLIVIGSDTFVVMPHHFRIENIKCSDGTTNFGATNSEEEKFCRAGDDFHVQVSARNAYGDITENFGREDSPESINIVSELVQPVGGNAPELSAPSVSVLKNCEGLDADATFCVTTSWPEVGIIKLIPGIGDGDYLGAGDVNETAVEHVGRFYPHHFELTQGDLSNRVESGCSDSVFTYLGENLEFSYELTAKNAVDGTTQNYMEPFHKLSGDDGETIFPGEIYSVKGIDDPNGADTTSLNERITIVSLARNTGWENGNAAFTVGFNVARDAEPDGPFTDVHFSVYVEDGDGVQITALDLDTDGDGIADSAQAAPQTQLRYGRINLGNAHGSELLDLPMPLHAEYWNGNAFILNDLDNCTLLTETELTLTNAAGTSISGTNSIEVGGGKNTSASISNQPLNAGNASLVLSAPGEDGEGWINVDLSVPDYLQYDWKGNGNDNPTARATFGIYKGNERIIYLRETTWR